MHDVGVVRSTVKKFGPESRNVFVFTACNKNIIAAISTMARHRRYGQNSFHMVLHGGLAEVSDIRRNPVAKMMNLKNIIALSCRPNI